MRKIILKTSLYRLTKTEWEGECFIKYIKVLVNNEMMENQNDTCVV